MIYEVDFEVLEILPYLKKWMDSIQYNGLTEGEF